MGLNFRGLKGGWIGIWVFGFLEEFQRRGVHVNIPKRGSRVGVLCFGGIWVFHAVLRREFIWGN
jgi:hypothetical protein